MTWTQHTHSSSDWSCWWRAERKSEIIKNNKTELKSQFSQFSDLTQFFSLARNWNASKGHTIWTTSQQTVRFERPAGNKGQIWTLKKTEMSMSFMRLLTILSPVLSWMNHRTEAFPTQHDCRRFDSSSLRPPGKRHYGIFHSHKMLFYLWFQRHLGMKNQIVSDTNCSRKCTASL